MIDNLSVINYIVAHFGNQKGKITFDSAHNVAYFLWLINYRLDSEFLNDLALYAKDERVVALVNRLMSKGFKNQQSKRKLSLRRQAYKIFIGISDLEIDVTAQMMSRAADIFKDEGLRYFKAYCWVYQNRFTEKQSIRFKKPRKDTLRVKRNWYEKEADRYINMSVYDGYTSAKPWGNTISHKVIYTPMDGLNKR